MGTTQFNTRGKAVGLPSRGLWTWALGLSGFRLACSPRSSCQDEVDTLTVRGQYGPGSIAGKPVPGYRQEQGVDPNSNVETFVALKLEVDNWRWAGVPFYLRHGKRLPRQSTEIAITFKAPPLGLFKDITGDSAGIERF